MVVYRYFYIESYEHEPGRWRARISRTDGKHVRGIEPETDGAFVDTADALSEEDAVRLAKQAIEDGRIR